MSSEMRTTESIQALKTVPMPEIVSSRLPQLAQAGDTWRTHCPFCQDSDSSFTVFAVEGGWLFHCLNCDATGNVFQFIAKFDKVSIIEAIEEVAKLSAQARQ